MDRTSLFCPHPISIFCLSITLTIISPDPAHARDPRDLSHLEKTIIEGTIAARTQRGRSSLQVDMALTVAASLHSKNMADIGFLGHRSPNGDRLWDRFNRVNRRAFGVPAENVAMRTAKIKADTGARFVSQWMESPGHRKNILNDKFSHTGVGCGLRTPKSSPSRHAPATAIYCTQLFLEAYTWADQDIPTAAHAGQVIVVRLLPRAGYPLPISIVQERVGSNARVSQARLLARQGMAEGKIKLQGPPGLYSLAVLVPSAKRGTYKIVPGPYLMLK